VAEYLKRSNIKWLLIFKEGLPYFNYALTFEHLYGSQKIVTLIGNLEALTVYDLKRRFIQFFH